MAANEIKIVVTATGAEAAAKVLADVAKSGAQIGSITAAGAKKAEDAFGGLGKTAHQVSGVMQQAGINTGIFGQAIAALTGPFGIAAAGVVALGLAIKGTTDFMTQNYTQMRQLMAVSGQSAEETDQLADAFDLLGFNVEALRGALFKMAAEVDSGGKGLRELGVSLRGVTGEIKTEGAIFLEVRNRISEMGSASERNAAAMKFFGRSAREMADVFALSTEEFTKWLEKAGMIGPSAEDSLRVTKDYTRALALFNKEWQGLVETVGQYVLPILTSMITAMTRIREIRIGETTAEWDEFLTGVTDKTKAASAAMAALAVDMAKNQGLDLGAGQARVVPPLTKAEVEDIKLGLKEVEAARLRSIDVVEARGQAAVKAEQMTAAQAAAQSITLARDRAAARIAAIDGEIDAIKRTSTTEIKAHTEADDKIRELTIKRADEHGKMASTVIAAEGSITAATLASQKAINDALGGLTQAMAVLATQTSLFPLTDEQKEIQAFNVAIEQARSKLDDLKKVLDPADWQARMKAFDEGTKNLRDWAAALAESKQAVEDAKTFYAGLKENWDAGAKSIEAMEFSYEKWLASINANGALDEAKAFYDALPSKIDASVKSYESIKTPLDDAARASMAFQESLAGIQREAALVGRDFDLAAANLAAFQKRILELQAIKNPTGEVLAEVAQLKAQFADTQEFIRWRDTFQDIFSSVGRTMNTLVEGFILGTQTIGEAFKKLGQSIIVNFVNAIIQQALNPLAKAAAGVVAGLFSGGGSSTATAAGVNGGNGGGSGGFGVPSIPTGIFDTGTLSNLWTGATNAVGAFNASLDAGGTVIESVSGAWDSFMVPLSGAASGLTVGLAGVGAAVAAFGTIMDFVNGKTEAAIGGVVGGIAGAVGGGLIGTYVLPGIGTALGALAGGALGDWLGSMFGGLFGGPSQYALKRAKAADEANAYLGGTTQGYQSALETRSAAQILAALQSVGTGVNPLRTELVLTSNMAAQLGISGQREGDNIIARWTDVNEAQMNELIGLFKLNPDLVPGAVRGAGDVGYLAQDKAHEFSAQLELGAEALLTAFTGLGAVTDKINEVAGGLTAAAQEALPPSLAQEFADGIVNPIRDRMLAVINSGLPVKEMQKQLDTINTELQGKVEAWNMFAVAIKQATVVDALIPADLHEQFRAVMEPAYDEMLNAMRNGTSAQAALQADHFAKQTQAWAAFADAVQAQVGVEMLLEPIADLGDRFSAAMQPVYDKILASLLAGNGAIALAQAQTFAKLTQAWAALGSTVAKSIDVESLLPDDLGDKFRARMQPEYDKILGTLVSGNAEVASALIATFDQQLAAWASMGQTVTRITGELAGLTGNLDGSVEAWVAVQQQMDGAVTRAQAAFATALAGGNVERIAATAAALHDAALTRVQAETQMLAMVQKLEAATLAASSGLADLVTTIATLEVATSGGLGTIEALLGSLEQMARTGATAEQRLWAVQAGLKAIAAVLPGLVERFAAFTTAAEFLAAGMQTTAQLQGAPGGPGGITPAILNGALPFLTALEDLIGTASGTGQLQLLQQQAEAFQSLAAAAVAAVNQWAQAAITAARAAAAEVIEGARVEAARRIDVARTEAARRQALIDAARDKALATIDAQIEAAQELAEVEQAARRAEMDALRELISKSKEWEAAVESMGKFIQSLKVGPLGPGNPADKLRQSQDVFAKALAAYNANPTAGGLSDLQGLAQTMLSLAEPIFSKPSPQFQALSASTIKQLEAAQALAQAQVTDSKVLQAQLDMLIALDKTATQDAKDQLEAMRKNREAVSKDFEKQTKDLSDALELYIGGIDKDLANYIKAVETALKTQVTAIEEAAKAEVTAINTNLIGALNANAAAQAIAIKDQKDASDALVRALTSTEFGANLGDIATYAAQRQDVAIGILESIRNGISLAVGTPLAQGSERVTEGLYHLHDDEMVLPKAMADKIRSAQEGAGLPSESDIYGVQQTAASNTGPWAPGSNDPLRDPWLVRNAAFTWTGPAAAELNAIENRIGILQMQYTKKERGNSYKKGGKIYHHYTAAQLAAMKTALDAQVEGMRAQQKAILAALPPPTVVPPPGAPPPPPGAPPPGAPPPLPTLPAPSPGAPWLTRPPKAGGTDRMGLGAGGGYPAGDGAPITIIVKLDGKTIGTATLPTVQADARSGKMRTIILETK